MSYDLNFWRYAPETELEHGHVYQQLCEGTSIAGVERLPIDAILRRVREVFADWQKVDDFTFDGGDRGGFQLYTTPQFFRVDCYGLNGEDMNKFMVIANEFVCPLYDPQTGNRFDRSS